MRSTTISTRRERSRRLTGRPPWVTASPRPPRCSASTSDPPSPENGWGARAPVLETVHHGGMIASGRALLVLSIAAATLTAHPGLGSDPTPTAAAARAAPSAPGPLSPTLAEVQRVLDARVDAIGRGDREAFLATIDPVAPAAFRQAQATSFDGLRSLPLASFSLTARLDDTGDLGAGLSPRYGGAPTFLPETRMRMRFAATTTATTSSRCSSRSFVVETVGTSEA